MEFIFFVVSGILSYKPPTIQNEGKLNTNLSAFNLARLVLSSFASRKEAYEKRSETYRRTSAEKFESIFVSVSANGETRLWTIISLEIL